MKQYKIPMLGLTVMLIVGIAGFCRVYSVLGQEREENKVPLAAANEEVDKLNREIQNKKESLDYLQTKQEEFKKIIEQKQGERADLENQLAIFDNRIAATQASIDDVKINIEKTELEIKKIDLEISLKLAEIEKLKEKIADALGMLYKEGSKSDLEVILLNDNLSTYIDQIQHLRDVNSGIGESVDSLKAVKEQLENDKKDLDIKRLGLETLKTNLQKKIEDLQAEKDGKQIVLDETKSSESEYQTMLANAKKEQQDASLDISLLEKKMRAELESGDKMKKIESEANGYIWPVTKNTITAYFHDPEYPYRNVYEHPAIDIRAKQGSQVKAVASGYVARVKPGPDGSYAYVMLVHANGISTVYGHVSKIFVEEEQYITQGQVIALSGGMPGTPGAGKMTTGSHLHLEFRLNGIPVNPLEYISE